jgi:hypothetical protein
VRSTVQLACRKGEKKQLILIAQLLLRTCRQTFASIELKMLSTHVAIATYAHIDLRSACDIIANSQSLHNMTSRSARGYLAGDALVRARRCGHCVMW